MSSVADGPTYTEQIASPAGGAPDIRIEAGEWVYQAGDGSIRSKLSTEQKLANAEARIRELELEKMQQSVDLTADFHLEVNRLLGLPLDATRNDVYQAILEWKESLPTDDLFALASNFQAEVNLLLGLPVDAGNGAGYQAIIDLTDERDRYGAWLEAMIAPINGDKYTDADNGVPFRTWALDALSDMAPPERGVRKFAATKRLEKRK